MKEGIHSNLSNTINEEYRIGIMIVKTYHIVNYVISLTVYRSIYLAKVGDLDIMGLY